MFFLLWDGRHSHKAGPTEGGHISWTTQWGPLIAERAPEVVRDRLGPVPSGETIREAWIEAAGRMAQHQEAWDVPEHYILGRKPQMFHDDAYELTWQAAVRSISALDRSTGRQLEIEPPSRSLGR